MKIIISFYSSILFVLLLLLLFSIWPSATSFAREVTVPTNYEIQGVVWTDFNRDGIPDEAEPRTPNAIIYIQAVIDESGDGVGLSDSKHHLQSAEENDEKNDEKNDYGLIDEDRDIGMMTMVQTNSNGQYKVGGLGTGIYKIWAESAGVHEAVQLHVGESEGILANPISLSMPPQQLFIPILMHK